MTKAVKVPITTSSPNASAAIRWVGGTTTGAPSAGTWTTGDFVIAQDGRIWICTAGGTPGTWVAGNTVTAASSVTSETTYGISSAVGTSLNYARQDHTHGTPATPVTSLSGTANQITVSATTGAVVLSLPAIITAPGTLNTTGNLSENGNRVYSAGNANLAGTVVSEVAYGLSATAGSATTYSKGDHSHGSASYPLWKDPVRAASTANVTIASALVNGLVMDGVTLATGDRVLLKNQTTQSENGIYVVVASGAASRAADADTGAKLVGANVFVTSGGQNFTCWYNQNSTITLGTTSITFSRDFLGLISLTSDPSSAISGIQFGGSGTVESYMNLRGGTSTSPNYDVRFSVTTTSGSNGGGTLAITAADIQLGGVSLARAVVGGMKIQSGICTVTFSASADGTGTVTFSPAFSAVPVIVASIIGGSGATGGTVRAGQSATTSSSPINCHATASLSTTWTVYWIAIGT